MQTFTLSGVTGNATLPLAPRAGAALPGLDNTATNFDLFRVVQLRYRIFPMDPTDTVNQVAAFVPDIDVQTQTVAALSESTLSTIQTPFCGVASRWVNVPRASLKGMLDWYKCTADAGAAEFESQGLIIISGGLSDQVTLEVEGIVEFKNPVNDTLAFERTIDRAVSLGKVVRVAASESATLSPGKPQVTKGEPRCLCTRGGV